MAFLKKIYKAYVFLSKFYAMPEHNERKMTVLALQTANSVFSNNLFAENAKYFENVWT